MKLVYDKNEKTLDKLTTVYHTLTSYTDASIIMILISDGSAAELYCGVACRDIGDKSQCDSGKRGNQCTILRSALEANFPGGEFATYDGTGNKGIDRVELIDRVFRKKGVVSAVTGVAALRGEGEHKSVEFVQGLEKLIDAMRGKPFSAVFIADCMQTTQIESMCADYEDVYSAISPFAQSQLTRNFSAGTTDTDSLIEGVTDTTNESVSNSENHGTARGRFKANTIGGNVGGKLGPVDVGVSYNHSTGTSESETDAVGTAITTGSAKSLSSQNSVAKSISNTTSDGVQITYQNRSVKTLMERIDEQIQRLRSCEDYGIYDFGAYFIAETTPIAKTAASVYNSLMRGEKSSVEASSVNTWTDKNGQITIEYLKRMYHPQIAIPDFSNKPTADNQGNAVFPLISVTPTALVSGKELPIHMSLPKKSVKGVAVLECAEFGREVLTYSFMQTEDIPLGNIYHMRKPSDIPLALNANSLTAHTFITGSTGAGKSNTIYTMLDRLCLSGDNKTHFLVIEPAKGEYKDALGGCKGVSVFGTNSKIAPLLRLNPFSFPADTHVLEHIDRLIEIFNACWPMYAAMPAVLKAAVEKAYINAGWSLSASSCPSGRFPTFRNVMDALPEVIDSKGFSKDTQGDYKGALLTRIESLTNGINGQVLCSQFELTAEDLFDRNVIVDLSRVGSMETKSLLMGILVLKLQEHRMAERSDGKNKPNSGLQHITVLEEAHNLLRRTSSEQTQESSNLQGKSVEMLANAIAELRSFGEGFIIADQSPGLLDMAVIRNTNTKIIMRLPDEGDRELVGKAAGLNDDQIIELSKLETGVAAIFQNEWLEPVLCKVEKFTDMHTFSYQCNNKEFALQELFLKELIAPHDERRKFTMDEVDQISRWIDALDTSSAVKQILHQGVVDALPEDKVGYALYCAVKGKSLLEQVPLEQNQNIAPSIIEANIMDSLNISRELSEEIRKIVCIYASELVKENIAYRDTLRYYGGDVK
ncbi:MAG: ATP-binding protein [Oscillospiraceae bacterium]|nr:ATP-binding protein [Oscillospiraceae bacterium]